MCGLRFRAVLRVYRVWGLGFGFNAGFYWKPSCLRSVRGELPVKPKTYRFKGLDPLIKGS